MTGAQQFHFLDPILIDQKCESNFMNKVIPSMNVVLVFWNGKLNLIINTV